MSRSATERNIKPTILINLKGTVTNISDKPGYLIKLIVHNGDSPNTRFLQVFDALATNVTLGTTKPIYILPVPIASIDDNDFGIEFDNGCSCAMTTTPTGSIGATSGATVTAVYKYSIIQVSATENTENPSLAYRTVVIP